MHGYEGPATHTQGADKNRPWGLTLGSLGLGGRSVLLTLRAEEKVFRVVFDRGIVIAASSPVAADSVARVALTTQLITPAQVDDVKRRLAASPGADEVDVLATVARLPVEQVRALRRRLIVQRAARTFSVERGAYELDERAPLPVVGLDIGVDVRTVIYTGARTNLSELRLAIELRQLGRRFALRPDAIEDLRRYGFTRAERPVLEALRRGTSLAELQENQRELDPRIAQAVIYALASCDALMVTENIAKGSGAMPPIRVEVEPPQSLASLLPRASSPVPRDLVPPERSGAKPPAASDAPAPASTLAVRLQPQTSPPLTRAKTRTMHPRAKTRTIQPRMRPPLAKPRTDAPPLQSTQAPSLPQAQPAQVLRPQMQSVKMQPVRVQPAQPEPQAYPVQPAQPAQPAQQVQPASPVQPALQARPVQPAQPVPQVQPLQPSKLYPAQPEPPRLPAGMRPMPPTVPLQPSRASASRARTVGKIPPALSPAVPVRAATPPPPIPARTAATPPPIPARGARSPVPVAISHAPTEPAPAPISHAPTAPVPVPVAFSHAPSGPVPVPVLNDFSPHPRSLFDMFRTNLTTNVRPNALAAREVTTLIEQHTALLDRGADHFALLGVVFGAPIEEVHAAYVELSRHLRPARLAELGIEDESFAADRLHAQLGIAFTVLTDRVLRAEYIAALHSTGRRPPAGRG
jgi:hypothetical protein